MLTEHRSNSVSFRVVELHQQKKKEFCKVYKFNGVIQQSAVADFIIRSKWNILCVGGAFHESSGGNVSSEH